MFFHCGPTSPPSPPSPSTSLTFSNKPSPDRINSKNQLEEHYDDIVAGIKVRSKCKWYEEG